MSDVLQLLPAIDVRSGQAIRISASGSTTHGSPQHVASDFQSSGASWLHLVDLDSAFGTGDNRRLLEETIDAATIPVQLSGGITTPESLQWALGTGASRINIGAGALTNLDWVRESIANYRDRLALSIDVDGDRVVSRGTGVVVGALGDLIPRVPDAAYLVVTDVSRDGNLSGPNFELLERVAAETSSKIIASGGVASLDDIDQLREKNFYGAIVGKALYVGAFALSEALARAGQ